MNLDDSKLWQERIRWAHRYRERLGRKKAWRMARAWYKNEYGEDVVSVNLVFAIGRKLVTDLYFKNPVILVKPQTPDSVTNAPIMEAVDRHLVDVMSLKTELKALILDAYRTNMGVMKVGYHCWSTITPDMAAAHRNRGAIGQLKDLLSEVFGDGGPDVQNPDIDDPDYALHTYDDLIKPNTPWIKAWPPEDFLLPWGCRTSSEAAWCAFRFCRPKFAMLHDPAYTNVKDIKGIFVDPGLPEEGLVSPKDFEVRNRWPEEHVIGYEIWDKQTGRVRVCTLDGDKWQRNEEIELGNEGLPFELLQFNPTGDDCYGTTDVEQIKKQVLELNETRTIEMQHKKMALTRLAFDVNKIPKDAREKLLKGQIMVGIPCEGNPDQIIRFYVPPMSSDLYQVSDVIRRDIAEMMNFSRNQSGTAESPRKSASEAMIIQSAIEQRSDERRDQVGDFIERLFSRQIQPITWKQWTTQRYVRIAGAIGDPNDPTGGWRPYIAADLKGFYGVSVTADSAVPFSKAERKQDVITLFEAFNGDPFVNQYNLRRKVLETHEGIDVSELLLTPEQIQMALQQKGPGKPGKGAGQPGAGGGKEKPSGSTEKR